MIPVRLKDVTKAFGPNPPAVRADLTIEAGEFFTLLGPSGCGKSTMLRMIAGFVGPSSGRVYFGERDVTATPPNKRDTGMVFQNYALFPHMSVAQNVAYGLTVRKVPRSDKWRRVEQALEQVGLAGYGGRRVDQLSGGQQQRVALARAVVISPSVLLLDEPLSNLDAKLREETRVQIRDVQTTARITGVYVTHDQAEAMAMSDRIAVLEAGRVHQVGTPKEIYHRPATAYVARFIGNSNVLPVRVGDRRGDKAEVVLPGGQRMTVACAGDGATRGEGQISIRPETFEFTAPEGGTFRGRVRSREFNGATNTYVVDVGDTEVSVTGPDGAHVPEPGEDVGLDCSGERVWLVSA